MLELLIEEELSNYFCKMLGECRILLQRNSSKPKNVCDILGCTIEILKQKQLLFNKMNNLLGNRIDRLLAQHDSVQIHLQTISQSQASIVHKFTTPKLFTDYATPFMIQNELGRLQP